MHRLAAVPIGVAPALLIAVLVLFGRGPTRRPEAPESRVRGGGPASSGSQNDNRTHVDSAFEDRDVAQCAPSPGLGQVVAKVHAQAWTSS
jgi:hypothetical protein